MENMVCSRCVTKNSMPDIQISEMGLCNLCEEHDQHPGYDSEQLVQEMKRLFEAAKKKRGLYDVLMCFSGGKDSTYLLHLLKNKYGFRPLAVSVVHPFMNVLSLENMDSVARKLDVDLIKFTIQDELFKKVIRYGIENTERHQFNERLGCTLCGSFHHNIPFKIAHQMGIPLIINGVELTQVGFPLLTSGEDIRLALENGIPYFGEAQQVFREVMGEDFSGSMYDMSLTALGDHPLPSEVSPFTFMESDFRNKRVELEKLGLLDRKSSHSLLTNCAAHHFFSYFTYKQYDCHSYSRVFATGLRLQIASNLDQLGDDGAMPNLSRSDTLEFIEAHKELLFYIVSKGKDVQETDFIKFCRDFPIFEKFMGEQGLNPMIEDMKKVFYFSEFFDIPL